MKRACAFSFVLSSSALMLAQNLVSNGSFEDYSACPSIWGSVNLANGWFATWQSPDYFNACDTTDVIGVPWSNLGYQYAADGQAYMGMITSPIGGVPWYMEIIAAPLTEPLVPGVPVCLSFQTAMGGFGNMFGTSTIYSCKGLGMKFFTELPADWQNYLYPNSAALSIQEVPTDTARWYYVSGVYLPDSAYQFVAIGNFFADSLIDLTLIDSAGVGGAETAYAFVDDVRASFNLTYCTSGISETTSDLLPVNAYPMPCDEGLHLELPRTPDSLLRYGLLDMTGRIVASGRLRVTVHSAWLSIGQLPNGPYTLQLQDNRGNARAIQVVHVSP